MFEPDLNTKIRIQNHPLSFTEIGSGYILAEEGMAAIVFKVTWKGKPRAFKVFFPGPRARLASAIVANSSRLAELRDVRGLAAADRLVVTREDHPHLIQKYGDLEYAVLMPWLEGLSWAAYLEDEVLTQEQSLVLASRLATILRDLEERGLAHCDLSSGNLIISDDLCDIELVDIEDLYSPDMTPPAPGAVPAGTPGYVPEWVAREGTWGPKADRYAGGILLSEILGWYSPPVRDLAFGESYFHKDDFGQRTERYETLEGSLAHFSHQLAGLLERVWHARSLDQCPALSEWSEEIARIEAIADQPPPLPERRPRDPRPPEEGKRNGGLEFDISTGAPPKLTILPGDIDFGVVDPKDGFKAPPVVNLKLLNEGGSELTGSVQTKEWLMVHPTTFHIAPQESIDCRVTLNRGCPIPESGSMCTFPAGLIIESNGGTEVVGAQYRITKRGLLQ